MTTHSYTSRQSIGVGNSRGRFFAKVTPVVFEIMK